MHGLVRELAVQVQSNICDNIFKFLTYYPRSWATDTATLFAHCVPTNNDIHHTDAGICMYDFFQTLFHTSSGL